MKQQRFAVSSPDVDRINLREDMAIGHEKVRPSVVIVVSPHHSQAVVADVIVDSSLFGDFLKSAVASIVIKKIGLADQTPRAALHEYTLVFAIFVAAKCRKVVHIYRSVARDEQVDVAISVIVAPRGSCAESTTPQSSFLSNVFELAVAQTAIEHVAAVAGNEKIEFSIIVIISDSHAHAPAQSSQPGFFGSILKVAVSLLAITGHHGISARFVSIYC